MKSDIELNGGRIIADGSLLDSDVIVSKPLARDNEAEILRTSLEPMLKGQRPINTWLCGPPGSGKTLLARYVAGNICPPGAARIAVYINCWQHRSLCSVLQVIISEFKILGADTRDTNVKLERIRRTFGNKSAVIILDEIDKPMPLQREEIIYGLLSLPKTGLICIANSTQTLASLDKRIQSRLGPVVIELPFYSPKEIEQILIDRAQRALEPGSWSPVILHRIANATAGDARAAIQTLRQAAAYAEQTGSSRLESRFIESQLQKWRNLHRQARTAGLSEHEKIIHTIVRQYASIATTELSKQYIAHCEQNNIQPMARRTFTKYLSRLTAAGVVTVVGHCGGTGGRLIRATTA